MDVYTHVYKRKTVFSSHVLLVCYIRWQQPRGSVLVVHTRSIQCSMLRCYRTHAGTPLGNNANITFDQQIVFYMWLLCLLCIMIVVVVYTLTCRTASAHHCEHSRS
jgi:hypothetical protein